MDRLEAMALFVAAVEGGSLAAAARRHGRSPAGVTRAVALLERQTEEALLLRSTRRLSLTAAGERHLAVWRDVLARLDELDPDRTASPVHGRLVLTAPELCGRLIVLPRIETFLERHPHVTARILLLNRMVDLIGEGVDLAVRLAPLRDTNLTAIKVGEVRTLICAAPAYLERHGVPLAPADLEEHACIGLEATAEEERWSFTNPAGRPRSVRVRPRLAIDSAAAIIDAALRGRGLIQPRSYQVAEAIADGRLVRLLRDWESQPTPAFLLFSAQRAGSKAMRALLDHLVPELRTAFSTIQASVDAGANGGHVSPADFASRRGRESRQT